MMKTKVVALAALALAALFTVFPAASPPVPAAPQAAAPQAATPQAEERPLAFPPPRDDPDDLVGAEVFNTGAVVMDGKLHWVVRRNKTDRPIKVVALDIWLGADLGTVGDMNATVFRVRADRSHEQIAQLAWDHYAQPTGLHQRRYNFAPRYFAVAPGEALALRYFFARFSGPAGAHGHVLCVAHALSQ
jgi:hypothetical protein